MIVVLPAAESPTTPRMIGRGITRPMRSRVEHPAGADVLRLDPHELLERRRWPSAGRLVEPVGLPQPGALDRVADAAGVGETGLAHPPLEVLAQRLAGLRRQRVDSAGEHQLGDRHQLVERVVGEVDVVGDARGHPRVQREELVHPVLVAGQDHDQPSRSFSITWSRISIASTP